MRDIVWLHTLHLRSSHERKEEVQWICLSTKYFYSDFPILHFYNTIFFFICENKTMLQPTYYEFIYLGLNQKLLYQFWNKKLHREVKETNDIKTLKPDKKSRLLSNNN